MSEDSYYAAISIPDGVRTYKVPGLKDLPPPQESERNLKYFQIVPLFYRTEQ